MEATLSAGVHWSTKQAVPEQISITSRVPSSLQHRARFAF